MVPVKGVKEDLVTDTKQLIYVPVATENTFGSVKLGHDFKLVDGRLTQKRASGSKTYVGYSDNNEDIALELLEDDVVVLEYDLYINVISGDLFQYHQVDDRYEWVKVGNIKGPAGTFKISKTYSSVDDMNASYSTDGLPIGSLVVINSNTESSDNARLYVKGEFNYEYLTDMSGPRGLTGDKGEKGDKGDEGSVFTPTVSADGILSWTNNGGLDNPSPVNVKGVKGDIGPDGRDGNGVFAMEVCDGDLILHQKFLDDVNFTIGHDGYMRVKIGD